MRVGSQSLCLVSSQEQEQGHRNEDREGIRHGKAEIEVDAFLSQ